jgi:hypothetical protein
VTPVAGKIVISPAQIGFGRRRVGSTTVKSVKISAKKSNKSQVLLEGISASGNDYAWDPATSTCVVGGSLAPKAPCTIAVKFTPLAVTKGESDTGQLIVTTDAEVEKPSGGRIPLKGGGRK